MHIPYNKDQIKTDKISEKLSGKEQFAEYPLKIGRTNPR